MYTSETFPYYVNRTTSFFVVDAHDLKVKYKATHTQTLKQTKLVSG